MCRSLGLRSACGTRRRRQGGFTLFESILVVVMLTLVSLGLIAMQPQVFKTQNDGRDQYIGLELMRACAERLLAVRRYSGYGSVTSTLCNGMGGLSGFSDPTVTLSNTPCSTSTCTATIIIAKTAAPAVTLASLTLQLSAY